MSGIYKAGRIRRETYYHNFVDLTEAACAIGAPISTRIVLADEVTSPSPDHDDRG